MWHVHTAIYPAQAGRFGEFMNGDQRFAATVAGILLMLPLFVAAIPLGFMLGNCIVWCIPPARKALERESQGVKWASFREAMSGLWNICRTMVPICLLLSFIGAVTMMSLK